ncbi:MAG: SoxR reducing system RseC family protein [Clostridia bacterium]|nr:SoxR reducing system RseC family protein [Clostridia bacterium]
MEQNGKIVELVDDTTAKVTIMRHSACEKCGACHVGSSNRNVSITAENNINAQLGHIVEVQMATQNVLSAALIMYVIPLIILVTGILIGTKLFQGEKGDILSIILGFVLLALSYFVIKKNEHHFSKKYKAVITKIIE